jgi:amino acid transporter
LMPIFLLFLGAHIVLIFGGIVTHAFRTGEVVNEIQTGYSNGVATLGFFGVFAIFLRAYSMGAGTYTGIEAVSNGVQIMRDPKVPTAKRTMVYMAVSLSLTAGGIMICYLLFQVTPVAGKTMNAVLVEKFSQGWNLWGLSIGEIFVIIVLVSEAALLFVAAQAGFIDGPRVMSNMAGDSWLPHRFSSLSDRLTMQNGVVLIAVSALLTLFLTKGKTTTLVLMYSINVFVTFSLSNLGMVRYWIQNRKKYSDWSRHIIIHFIGLVLCLSILIVSLFEKFMEGGWVTLVVTSLLVMLCLWIKKHYSIVRQHLGRLDDILKDIPHSAETTPRPIEPKGHTAILLVNNYGGLGIHSFLSIQRLFPHHFKNFIFVSVNVVDAGLMKGVDDVNESLSQTEVSLKKYVVLANNLGFAADYRMGVGTDVLEEVEELCIKVSKEFPRSIFFAGKLVFQQERWYQRLLHNETANQFQRRLQFAGLNTMVLPVRVFASQTATS